MYKTKRLRCKICYLQIVLHVQDKTSDGVRYVIVKLCCTHKNKTSDSARYVVFKLCCMYKNKTSDSVRYVIFRLCCMYTTKHLTVHDMLSSNCAARTRQNIWRCTICYLQIVLHVQDKTSDGVRYVIFRLYCMYRTKHLTVYDMLSSDCAACTRQNIWRCTICYLKIVLHVQDKTSDGVRYVIFRLYCTHKNKTYDSARYVIFKLCCMYKNKTSDSARYVIFKLCCMYKNKTSDSARYVIFKLCCMYKNKTSDSARYVIFKLCCMYKNKTSDSARYVIFKLCCINKTKQLRVYGMLSSNCAACTRQNISQCTV